MATVGGGGTCKSEQVGAHEVSEHVAGGGCGGLPAQGRAETGHCNAQMMLTARLRHLTLGLEVGVKVDDRVAWHWRLPRLAVPACVAA